MEVYGVYRALGWRQGQFPITAYLGRLRIFQLKYFCKGAVSLTLREDDDLNVVGRMNMFFQRPFLYL